MPDQKFTCVTVSGPRANGQCVFPFIFNGVRHDQCVADNSDGRLTWCSTRVDQSGRHVKGEWGHCHCTTSGGCPIDSYNELVRASTSGTYLPDRSDASFRCGISRIDNRQFTFIIGGTNSDLQEYPFAVLLGYNFPNAPTRLGFFCGGSLINRRYVLTAAHCISALGPVKVRLGEHDITKDCDCVDDLCAPIPQTIDIEKIVVHEGYDGKSFVNDIALIRLAKLARLNAGVGAVCMPGTWNKFSLSELEGKSAVVMGWGRTAYFSNGRVKEIGAPTPVIQKVDVPIIDHQSCQFQYPSRLIDQRVICAGARGADSCSGDSGGPLVYRAGANEPWTLIGVVSYGDTRCGAGKAGVYTNVEHFMPWIKAKLEP